MSWFHVLALQQVMLIMRKRDGADLRESDDAGGVIMHSAWREVAAQKLRIQEFQERVARSDAIYRNHSARFAQQAEPDSDSSSDSDSREWFTDFLEGRLGYVAQGFAANTSDVASDMASNARFL